MVPEDGLDLESNPFPSSHGRKKKKTGQVVMLDSSQVTPAKMSCPFASLCLWTCDVRSSGSSSVGQPGGSGDGFWSPRRYTI
jgi:hypothetical protein